jgi:hypothetical protein
MPHFSLTQTPFPVSDCKKPFGKTICSEKIKVEVGVSGYVRRRGSGEPFVCECAAAVQQSNEIHESFARIIASPIPNLPPHHTNISKLIMYTHVRGHDVLSSLRNARVKTRLC